MHVEEGVGLIKQSVETKDSVEPRQLIGADHLVVTGKRQSGHLQHESITNCHTNYRGGNRRDMSEERRVELEGGREGGKRDRN